MVYIGKLAGAIAGIMGSLGIIWAGVAKFYKWVKRMSQIVEQAADTFAEFKPNGGASVRDQLNRIETRQILADQRHIALMQDVPFGVFEADKNGELEWVNRTFLLLTGRLVEEVYGNGWIVCVHPEDRNIVYEEWTKAVEQEREFDLVYRLVDMEGKVTYVQSRSYVLRNSEGEPEAYRGTINPIETPT